ncbi:MAG: RIP metalloprotease RseP [Candidatus Lindowbacteria bacterium]|nr:RIP metalloprotease RseP [Candidatus Lindowbacteria bacterium]
MNHVAVALDFIIGAGRFIILLGILVFVHELGHFIAAKLCNVYVVRFSLGFGKRLFGFKKGETDYCVSAIPLGGYVRMVGQEDLPKTQEERERAEPELRDIPPERRFDTQSVRNRLAISFAGPLMNLLFALPVLWLVLVLGVPAPIAFLHTRIGNVDKGSPAEKAGIKPGQRVLTIDGAPVEKFEDLQLKIWTSKDKPLTMELDDLAGEKTNVIVTPARLEDSSRATIGIEPLSTVAVNRILPNMPAARSGLKEGDWVLTYNHKTPDNENMGKLIETVNESAGRPLVLTVLRDGKPLDVEVEPQKEKTIRGVEFDGRVVSHVDGRAGLLALILWPGDTVSAIDGKPLPEQIDEDWLERKVRASDAEELKLTVEKPQGLLREFHTITVTVPIREKGMIGVLFSPFVTEKFAPGEAFIKSFGLFGDVIGFTMKSLYFLVAGRVSTKEMAGPIGIAVMTEQSLKLGVGYYLKLVAIITINLAIVNLFPIPVLDGGTIMISVIESIRRKPMDEKYLLLLQRVGLALVAFLILIATYNDILRVINYLLGGSFLE